jgi:hypothetical protein
MRLALLLFFNVVAFGQNTANDLLKQIRDGVSFEDIADKYSDGPNAKMGGALGFFKRALAKEIEDQTFAMNVGDVSDVIRSKQGFSDFAGHGAMPSQRWLA